jgi:hypothetical protein
MGKKDYSRILGVDKTAHQTEFERAFRRMARQCRRDWGPGHQQPKAPWCHPGEVQPISKSLPILHQRDRLGVQTSSRAMPWPVVQDPMRGELAGAGKGRGQACLAPLRKEELLLCPLGPI